MNPLDTNHTLAILDATQRELAELKAIAEQMAAALSTRHCQGCICPNCADASDTLDAYRTWEANQ